MGNELVFSTNDAETTGYPHKRSESRVLKRHICVSVATAGLFIAAKTGSNPKCPVTDKCGHIRPDSLLEYY